MSLGHEQRRLARAFSAVLLAVVPSAAMAEACSSSSDGSGVTDAAAEGASDSSDEDPSCSTIGIARDADPDADPDAAPDADPGCIYVLPCGFMDSGISAVGCDLSVPQVDAASLGCRIAEGAGCEADAYAPGPNGSLTLICSDCFGGGRKPAGLRQPRGVVVVDVGSYFARMAHDESASVLSFRRLQRDLGRFAAPSSLRRAASRATRDEIAHTRDLGRLARAHGFLPPRVRVATPRAPTLATLAQENAVEGCLHETFGALLLRWQATHARSAALRATFAKIAKDEARHAALAWSIARWAERDLSSRQRARIASARTRALRSLEHALAASQTYAFHASVGLPSRDEALALLHAMNRRLEWRHDRAS